MWGVGREMTRTAEDSAGMREEGEREREREGEKMRRKERER